MVFADFAAWFIGLLQAFGPLSVFLGVLLEEIIIPIPSPLILMGAGFVMIPAGVSAWEAFVQMTYLIVLPAAIAGTIGSFFAYGIGYYGGRPVVERFNKFLGMSWNDVEKMHDKLGKGRKTWFMIFIFRSIPVFPISVISFAAGFLRLSPKKYAAATFLGSIPRAYMLGFAGWIAGNAFFAWVETFGAYENAILVVIVAAIVGAYLYVKKFRKASSSAPPQARQAQDRRPAKKPENS